MCLVMILVKKVFIFSKTMIICLLCPLLCGLFFFWKGAKGELSYKVKKRSSLLKKATPFIFLGLLMCYASSITIQFILHCTMIRFESFWMNKFSNLSILLSIFISIFSYAPVLINAAVVFKVVCT